MNYFANSGMSNAPLFIGWQPRNLDMTPYQRNQAMMMEMTQQLAREAEARRTQIRSMKGPEYDFLPNDTAVAENMFLQGRKKMVDATAVDNPFYAVQNDPSFAQGMEMVQRSNSSTYKTAAMTHKEQVEDLKKQIDARKGEGASSWVMTDENGRPVVDPDNPTELLSVGDFHTKRSFHPDWSIIGHGGVIQPKPVLSGFDDFVKRKAEEIKPEGFTETGGPGRSGVQDLGSSDPTGMNTVAMVVNESYKNRSNWDQLMSGLDLAKTGLTAEDKVGLLNRYKDTAEFHRYKEAGRFNGADGHLDPDMIYDAMLNSRDYNAVGPIAQFSSGKGQKLSFAERTIYNIADKQLSSSSVTDRSQHVLNSSEKGLDLSKDAKVNIFEHLSRGVPKEKRINPMTGAAEEVPLSNYGRQMDITVPVATSDGTVGLTLKNGAFNYPIPGQVGKKIDQAFGLDKHDSDGNSIPALAGETLTGIKAILPNGKVIDDVGNMFPNMKVLGKENYVQYRPNTYGKEYTDPDIALNGGAFGLKYGDAEGFGDQRVVRDPMLPEMDFQGQNGMNMMVVPMRVEFTDDSNDPMPTDYMPDPESSKGGLKEVRMDDTDYQIKTQGSSGTAKFYDPGQDDIKSTIYVVVPDVMRLYDDLKVDERMFMDFNGMKSVQRNNAATLTKEDAYQRALQGVPLDAEQDQYVRQQVAQ